MKLSKKLTLAILAFSLFANSGAVLADPPSHAPAHGYHKKHKHKHDHHETIRYLPIIETKPYVEVRCTQGEPILGAIIGGVTGGLIGNQFGKGSGNTAATIGGALAGMIMGQQVGMSVQNMNCVNQAFEYGKPGTQVAWEDPDSQQGYTIQPIKDYTKNGRQCREFQSRIIVDGKTQEGYGTACRQPDGSWEIVN